MKKFVIIFNMLVMLLSSSIFAQNIIYVHGTQVEEGQKILKDNHSELKELGSLIVKAQANKLNKKQLQQLSRKKKDFINKIKKQYKYLFVDLQILTLEKENNYLNLEVVRSEHVNKLNFVSTSDHSKQEKKVDIIKKMINYQHIAQKLVKNKKLIVSRDCPVNYCVFGFEHKKLEPYLKLFNKAIIDDKDYILNTLNNDPNIERRRAAAFLVAHSQDVQEVISLLFPYIEHKQQSFRDQIAKIIFAAMIKGKINEINVKPFIALLSSPYINDRYNGLLMLKQISLHEQTKILILKDAASELVKFLEIPYPVLQNITYDILKNISGKDFGENNIEAWQEWVKNSVV